VIALLAFALLPFDASIATGDLSAKDGIRLAVRVVDSRVVATLINESSVAKELAVDGGCAGVSFFKLFVDGSYVSNYFDWPFAECYHARPSVRTLKPHERYDFARRGVQAKKISTAGHRIAVMYEVTESLRRNWPTPFWAGMLRTEIVAGEQP
jgi:hypothetical protein